MMLYLTGAEMSITKSNNAPQNDPANSLGGYVSSSPVPNASVNALFDLLSIQTLKDKKKETLAIGLINKFDYDVKDVKVKIITKKRNVATFRLAAVELDSNLCMEHIPNRYAEPMQAEFHNVDFTRTSVAVTIINPGVVGEIIYLEPFNVTVEIEENGFDGNWKSIKKAFLGDENYSVGRLSENSFYIESKEDTAISEPLECSYTTTEEAVLEFDGKFRNEINNEQEIIETLRSGSGIGLWLQRDISDVEYPTNEQLIKDYDDKKVAETLEEVELLISYSLDE